MPNNHIFKLNNKPIHNYPYPFQLSYCPIKSCCKDEYAKLNANNIFCKLNTFNNKVVINSGNLQIKDLSSFPPTNPGYGNFASINGTPYYYDYILNTWTSLLPNRYSLTSSIGELDPTDSNKTMWTLEMSNNYGQLFNYEAYITTPPNTFNFDSNDEVTLQPDTKWGVSSGSGIFVPYTVGSQSTPGNGAYVFSAYNHPGFGNFTGLTTQATTNITGSNLYTTYVDGNYVGLTFTIEIIIIVPFTN
jgi:hypothetical protein